MSLRARRLCYTLQLYAFHTRIGTQRTLRKLLPTNGFPPVPGDMAFLLDLLTCWVRRRRSHARFFTFQIEPEKLVPGSFISTIIH